jgi:hypothetical protein
MSQDPGEPIDIADIRFAIEVEKLHRQPTRVLFEMLKELGRELMIRVDLEQRVRKYNRLGPQALAVTGSDRMVPALLYPVGDEP